MITSAISSAVDASAFLTTSSVIGSDNELDLAVAVLVEAGQAPRWDDAGRVGLVDEQRATPLSVEQAGPVADLDLDQADVRPEVGEARSLGEGEGADRGDRVVELGRYALDARDRTDRDDVDGIL